MKILLIMKTGTLNLTPITQDAWQLHFEKFLAKGTVTDKPSEKLVCSNLLQ
jgi:hypothetical protein